MDEQKSWPIQITTEKDPDNGHRSDNSGDSAATDDWKKMIRKGDSFESRILHDLEQEAIKHSERLDRTDMVKPPMWRG